MMSQGLAPLPSTIQGYAGDLVKNPESSNSPTTQQTASSSVLKRKRNLPGTPDPDSEVIALSPKSLMATNKFLCEVCNKGFQRDQNLQLHRRGHNLPWKLKQRSNKEIVKKKVYLCPEKSCVHHDPSRALGDLTGIKKHFSRKHGEKKWNCDKCPKKYAVKSDWKAHSKICGTREHKCDCGTLFSRKDSFITHRAFCTAVVDQSGQRFAPSAAGTNNPLSLRSGFLSGTFGNPQVIESHQFSGGGGGFYPDLSSNFHPYGHLNNADGSKSVMHDSQWLEHHQLNNASARFLMGNPTASNMSNDLLLQHAGQTNNLFGSSSSTQTPWLRKCQDQSAFDNDNLSSLDQIIGNNSVGGVMQVKREDGILSNEDLVENMTSLYNNQQQSFTGNVQSSDQIFLSSVFGRNNNNSLGSMNYGMSNGQVFTGNNGFSENSFSNSPFTRPPVREDNFSNNTENLNHLFLLHDAAEEAVFTGNCEPKHNTKQHDESSLTRDFLGVGSNDITREQFKPAAASGQFNSNTSAVPADLDTNPNQQWKH